MKCPPAIARLVASMILAATAASLPAENRPVGDRSPDHVLIWTRNVDKLTAIMAVKLGFQVRPGGVFGDGVANRIIRFPNRSYLELLYFAKAPSELQGQARRDYAATARGNVANNFGIQAADIDTTVRQLSRDGWKLDPQTPMTFDPDGPGPLPAQERTSRIVSFPRPPLIASDLFFIHYKPIELTATQRADSEVFTRHPNGALRLSSVWLLSGDPEVDAARLSRLGFVGRKPVEFPAIGLRGLEFVAGEGSILLLQPSGPGPAANALAGRGPHLYGVGIEVADLDRARRIVGRSYGETIVSYKGAMGDAFLVPTHGELGFVVEFHGSPSSQENGEAK